MKRFVSYVLIALFVLTFVPKYAQGFEFNKNYLINDNVFVDYNSMSENDIELFLKEKGSILARYKQNGIPASRIIFDAAQKYRINPKVILTTLQKEEALITLKSYSSYAINFAMGFHRPSDFKSQVYGGTKLLRDGYDFLAAKYGWKVGVPHRTEDNPKYVNNIVVPGNKATASLYLYTPYIGGYYTSSGSYIGGNYNFVKIFNRWFGDPNKYLSVKLSPDKYLIYTVFGKNASFSVEITNNGNVKLESGKYYLLVENAETDNKIMKIPLNFNLAPKSEKSVPVTLSNVENTTLIHCSLKDNYGKSLGNISEIKIVPVKFSVTYKIAENTVFLKITSDKTVPCAHVKAKVIDGDSGEEITEDTILNGELMNKSIECNMDIPSGYANVILTLSFFGTDSDCNPETSPAIFFSKTISKKRKIINLSVKTIPANASVYIDENFVGKSPLNLSLKQNVYTITVKGFGYSCKKDIELNYDTEITFALNGKKTLPPTIKTGIIPEITNKKTLSINGRVLCNTQTTELTINNNKLKIGSNGEFVYEWNLKEGNNKLKITAADNYGNSESLLIRTTLDITPPSIIVNKIPNITSDMFLKLEINVKDGSELFVNGSQCKFLNCTIYFKLKKGKNDIEIKAQDKAGNEAKKEINVIYLPPSPTVLKLFIGKDFLYINGVKKTIDSPPIIKENRTMLPIRHIIEALNGQIFYYPESRTVEIRINGGDITLAIGKNIAIVNGKEEYIDPDNKKIKPFIKNGRTYLPLRFVMESIGSSVEWIPKEKAVIVIYPKIT